MDADAFIPEYAAKRIQLMQEVVRRVGEPLKTGFIPTELAEDPAKADLRLIENLGPAGIADRFFQGRTDDYHAFEHVHFAQAVVGI